MAMNIRFPSRAGALSVLLVALLFCGAAATAQVTTADVVGTITDNTGAIVPGARVTITNQATRLTRTAQTDASGGYVFNLLPIGRYSVHIEAPNFKAFTIAELALSAGDRARVDARMQPGQVTESVQISAATVPALQTDSSTVGDVVTEQAVEALPLNGRNYVNLVTLLPGVNAGQPNAIASGNRPDDRRQSSVVSANGQSDLLNNSMLDGLDNNERQQGFIGVRPSIDAIAEIKVMTNLYSAEIGRTPGAVINIITKSGTNKFHGSAYEFFRNDIFDARDFFLTVGDKPPYRQNQFGGSFGGPIVKDKTFFFGDTEFLRVVQGIVAGRVTVPTLYQQQHPGDFSDVGGPVIPAALLNPIALKYFSLYPKPNLPGAVANFISAPRRTQNGVTSDVRVDHRFSDKDSFFARYSLNPVKTVTPGLLPPVDVGGTIVEPGGGSFPGTADQRSQGLHLNHVHVFRPNLLLELKAGYTRIRTESLPLNFGKNLSQAFGLPGGNLDPQTTGLTIMSVAGYQALGSGPCCLPILNTNNVFQYNGAVTYTRGAHNVKFGAALIRRQLNFYQAFFPLGQFNFGVTAPTSMAQFLLGAPLSLQRLNIADTQRLRTWEPSAYAQDDWRATNWLTFNLGLRYDIYTPFTDAQNKYSNFDPGALSIRVASKNDPTAGVNTYYRNIAPRFGFAATIAPGTVLRGGFGISYFYADTQNAVLNQNPPFTYSLVCAPLLGLPCPPGFGGSLSQGLPAPTFGNVSFLSGTLNAKDPNFRPSYLQQFNLVLQKEFGGNVVSAGYVGSLGRQLYILYDLNRPAPPGPNQPTPRLVYAAQAPAVSSIALSANGGNSVYNSLQLSFIRRFQAGLTFNANYTWAHGTDNTRNGSVPGGILGLLPRDPRYDWGNSDADIRHRIAVSANYQLPFGKSATGAMATLIKGWQVNGIGFWQSGQPFTVSNPNAQIRLPGVSADRPDLAPDQSIKLDNPTLARWFNTAAFRPQTPGTPGNHSRNQLFGPPSRRVDISLFKDFPLTEAWKLQFRAECYNISNTPNFANPNANLGAPGFGSITSTAVGSIPRQFQFALKLLF